MKRAALTALIMAASVGAASADCTPKPSDLDSFGIAQLGPDKLGFLAAHATQTKWCSFGVFAYCPYLDANRILYVWNEFFIDSKVVQLSRLRKRVTPPFGMTAADTPTTIQVKMRAHGVALTATADPEAVFRARMLARGFKMPATPDPDSERRNSWLTSGLCLKNPGGNIFSAWFEFDAAGRLVTFETHRKRMLD